MPETAETKTCTKCGLEKGVNQFGILKKSKDGRNPLCLVCKREYQSRGSKTGVKAKAPDRSSKPQRPKGIEPSQKKIIAPDKELSEARFLQGFKKAIIKNFIRDDLITALERVIEERFK
jgi:hypothetical protein